MSRAVCRHATAVQQQIGAVVVGSDPFLFSRREQIVGLAAHHAIATVYPYREFVAAGGLVSYGNSVPEAYRHAGLYVGRILRGAKPSDLPVERLTKFELSINLKIAKALGLVKREPRRFFLYTRFSSDRSSPSIFEKTGFQLSLSDCLNRRTVGYQGLSSRSNIQTQ